MKYRFTFERTQLLMLLGGIVLAGLLTYVAGVFSGLALSAPTKAEVAFLQAHESQLKQAVASVIPSQAAPAQPAPPPAAPASAAPGIVQDYPPPAAAPKAPQRPPPRLRRPRPRRWESNRRRTRTFTRYNSVRLPMPRSRYSCRRICASAVIPPRFSQSVDSDHKEWHEVRIGGFPTLSRASAAAAAFTNKERIQALIRRSGSL